MAPTIVFKHGRPVVALGSPGGATIITTVLQTLVNYIDFGMSLPDAVAEPRASQRNAPLPTDRRRPPARSSRPTAEPAFIAAYGPALSALGHYFTVPTPARRARSARSPAIRFLRHGRQQAVAEPTRRGGGSAMVVCARDLAARRARPVRARRTVLRNHTDGRRMLDVEDRLAELEELGIHRRMRMVSGPQGPRVVLDGRPVLLLCSDNHLGLADHPRVREAAADAAMRWGAGAGASRLASGTMTLHRRLEERLADFLGTEAALLFGSGYLANLGIIPALAERGEIVFADSLGHASVADGCRLAGAETFLYDHGDAEHLAWGLRNADGRAALIVTDGVFALDGDHAPLEEIVALAHRHDVRVMVGESHGLGAVGPDGRGAIAAAGLEREVDVVVGSLATALGAYGAFAACDRTLARYLAAHARSLAASTAPPPPVVAAAMAALELLREQPRRVEKLQANAELLRTELAREGFEVAGSDAHIVSLVIGGSRLALRVADGALEQGVYVGAVLPPDVPEGTARLRLAVMASHTKSELRDAARALGRAALRAGFRPGAGVPAGRRAGAGARPRAASSTARCPGRPSAEGAPWGKTRPMDLDLLVIGSGPSGQKAAIQAAKLGKRVAVVERRQRLGGVSIHTGTIPSKTLRVAVLDELARRPLDVPDPLNPEGKERQAIEFLMDRTARVVGAEAQVVREQFRRNRVGLLFGEAAFVDEHTDLHPRRRRRR